MNKNDVQLWFSKDKNGNIVTINEVDKENKHNKYTCPLCNSEVVARQGKINNWCFAHIDKSKCDSESMIHWWFKNKLIEKGDKFIVKSDVEKQYICKEILVEQSYNVGDKIYNPDVTVIAETGEIIYFEMENTNKKKIEQYLDIWIALGNIVVEVDIKTLISSTNNILPVFKALYYDDKCFNLKKDDETYYNTIGEYKERNINNTNNKLKQDIIKLDWLWNDIRRYKQDEVDIEYMSNLIKCIENNNSRDVVVNILKKSNCSFLLKEYISFNKNKINNYLKNLNLNDKGITYEILIPRKVFDRVYIGLIVDFYFDSVLIYSIDTLNVTTVEINKIIENVDLYNFLFKHMTDKVNNYFTEINYTPILNWEKPNINIWKSWSAKNSINNYRIYLNNFKNAKYGEYLTICSYKTKEEYIKRIETEIDKVNLFSSEDIHKLNDLATKLKNRYKENKFIEIYLEIKTGTICNIEVSDYINSVTQIEVLTNKSLNDMKSIYEGLNKKIQDILSESEIENNIYQFIDDLNEKYRKIKGGWGFSIDTMDNNYIGLRKCCGPVEELGIKQIEDYKNGKMKLDKLKEKISLTICNYIRKQVYKGGR